MAYMVIERGSITNKEEFILDADLEMYLKLHEDIRWIDNSIDRVLFTIEEKLKTIVPGNPWWCRWI